MDQSDISADYTNAGVESALDNLLEKQDYAALAELLNSIQNGQLFLDITGTSGKKKGPRMRITKTTTGQKVLPIFTSMQNLRAAHASGGRKSNSKEAKGAMMPALEALKQINSDRFVAIELNPGKKSLLVLRKFVALALSGEQLDESDVQKK